MFGNKSIQNYTDELTIMNVDLNCILRTRKFFINVRLGKLSQPLKIFKVMQFIKYLLDFFWYCCTLPFPDSFIHSFIFYIYDSHNHKCWHFAEKLIISCLTAGCDNLHVVQQYDPLLCSMYSVSLFLKDVSDLKKWLNYSWSHKYFNLWFHKLPSSLCCNCMIHNEDKNTEHNWTNVTIY